jgi:hypothetical protein
MNLLYPGLQKLVSPEGSLYMPNAYANILISSVRNLFLKAKCQVFFIESVKNAEIYFQIYALV